MMVSNILDYSKMRNGNLKPNYQNTDPLQIIRKVVELLTNNNVTVSM